MKTHRINGDDSGPFVSASRAPLPGGAERLSGAVVPAAGAEPAKPRHDPAFAPPQDSPAVPVDKYHGKGGVYALVDGKRVPADENGNPLPVKSK